MYNVYHEISSLNLQILKKYKADCEVFVETGTNTGKGIDTALKAEFQKVISFDVEEKFVNLCKEKFSSNINVNIFLGDSSRHLLENIKNVQQRILFWLDGHAEYSIPLLQELEQIKQLSNNHHIIMIDDVRMFGNPLWGGLRQQDALDIIYKINKNYKVVYEDSPNGEKDILIAYL